MTGSETLRRAAQATALRAAAELEALAGEGRLAADTKTARELCGVLKEALSLERELRAEERAAVLTVRFEGGTEDAAG